MERNEESCENKERKCPIVVPLVVRVVPVRVEPTTIVMAIHIEDVRVTVSLVKNFISSTTS
jgi:hypothetical protein